MALTDEQYDLNEIICVGVHCADCCLLDGNKCRFLKTNEAELVKIARQVYAKRVAKGDIKKYPQIAEVMQRINKKYKVKVV